MAKCKALMELVVKGLTASTVHYLTIVTLSIICWQCRPLE